MATNKRRLLKTVRLLDEIIDHIGKSKISESSQGPSGALLVRLKRLRELLVTELEQPEPNWKDVVVPLLREAARWLGEFVANNFLYILRSRIGGHAGIGCATWACA